MKVVAQIASFTRRCATLARRYIALVAFLGLLTISFVLFLISARSEYFNEHRVSLINSFPSEARGHWLCEKGLLLAEDNDPHLTVESSSLVFRDWDGNIQWRVKIPAVSYHDAELKNAAKNRRKFTVSPNGDVIGMADITHDGITIRSWKSEIETGYSVIPYTIRNVPS